jgi:F-type H+-transporting ATPase subunit b
VELNLSTFILELINFVVLVWILKRFLYKPVLDVIARRRAEINKTMDEAHELETNARALQQRYEDRLADWEAEQAKAREGLSRELERERSKQLSALQTSLEEERQKHRAAEGRRLEDLRDRYERAALALGARFASRLLEEAVTEDLHARLLARLSNDLGAASAEDIAQLLGNPEQPPDEVLITSAFPMSSQQADELGGQLRALTSFDMPTRVEVDPDLLAGVRLTIGASVLGLNLADELEGFGRLADGTE